MVGVGNGFQSLPSSQVTSQRHLDSGHLQQSPSSQCFAALNFSHCIWLSLEGEPELLAREHVIYKAVGWALGTFLLSLSCQIPMV